MKFKRKFKQLLWKFGYDIIRFAPDSHSIARRKKMLERLKIDTVIDVGANSGQFAEHLKSDLKFNGKIISFEPLSSAFKALKLNADSFDDWEVYNSAIGDVDGEIAINIAGNSYSSSILPMLLDHLKAAPESKYIGKETVKINRLDTVFSQICSDSESIFLKVDTQGYEKNVMAGAMKSLQRINAIQLEMSLVKLYQEEYLFGEMVNIVEQKGFKLTSVDSGFCDRESGRVLQVDGVFERI